MGTSAQNVKSVDLFPTKFKARLLENDVFEFSQSFQQTSDLVKPVGHPQLALPVSEGSNAFCEPSI